MRTSDLHAAVERIIAERDGLLNRAADLDAKADRLVDKALAHAESEGTDAATEAAARAWRARDSVRAMLS